MNRPIIALDFPSKREVAEFLAKFPKEEQLYVKVGMELFYYEGPAIIEWLVSQGHDIFLDLKLHDIPNTVHRAMKNLGKLGVAMTNVHAAGGKKMMMLAKEGLIEGSSQNSFDKSPQLIAVTQLTSTSEAVMQSEQMIQSTLQESVIHYARLAEEAGLDGVVCSALEANRIHQATNDQFICLTPGIRTLSDVTGDQQRVVTPEQARELTANYIVVGRPITQVPNPYEKYQQIKRAWNGEMSK